MQLTSGNVTRVKLTYIIIVESDLLAERLRNNEYIRKRKIVTVVEKYSFESVDWIERVYVKAATVCSFYDSNRLFTLVCALSTTIRINYLEVQISLVFLVDVVLCFENTTAIEYHFLLAEGYEKTNSLQWYCSVW